ncbi:MAG: cadherin-like domain-containing protein [Myxococcota bacterium]
MRQEAGGRQIADRCAATPPRSLGEEGARAFLENHADALGLSPDLADLTTVEVKHGLAGTRTLFAQQRAGLPIHDAYVSVNQDAAGRVTGLFANHHTRDEATGPLPPAALSAAAAETLAREAAGVSALRSNSKVEQVWFASSRTELRLAWRLMIYSDRPLGDFLTLVDDASGKILFQENRIAFATGSGFIYQPNPIQTSADTSLQDGNDSATAALDAERVNATLPRLDAGTGTLRGEYVDLVSLAGGRNVPDADEVSRVYEYDRNDARFEQVVIYATVDAIQDYFHTLGFDDDVGPANGIRDFPSLAHAHWDTADQSFYSTSDDAIHFGDGGVDDGEDADIIAHEYGHAIQFNQNACWGGGDMGAMGEGFGDYLAASFFADQGDAAFQSSHAACVGEWDAAAYSSSNPPCLRRVDGNKQYPGDLVGQVHADGEIWSRALWDLRQAIGGTAADQLVLEHHFLLPCNATMPDAAQQMLQADANLNGSANEAAIRTAFCDRGILTGVDCTLPSGLELSQLISPSPLFAGQNATLTLTATNTSNARMTGVTFTANVPQGSTLIVASISEGGSEASGTLTWPPVDLAAGASVQRSYQVQLDAGSGTSTLFEDDMESGNTLWSVSRAAGTVDWTLDGGQPRSGSQSWYASEPSATSDQRLTTTSPIAISSGTTLSFWHSYDVENNFDGGVVEASIDGGANWTDLGSAMTANGYSGTISTEWGSPIGGRLAFTGNSSGYVETVVDLQSLAGENALLRFRMTSDTSVAGNGWRVDDVQIGQVVSFESSFAASGGGTASSTSTVSVEAPPPNALPLLVVNAGLTLTQGTSAVIAPTLLQATDADPTDTLTYSVTTSPANGSLSPATTFTQDQIDAGAVAYQHDGGSSLSDAFEFSLSDGRGGTIAPTPFVITVERANQPPVLGISTLPAATADALYQITVSASDPDVDDTLTLFVDAGPAWLGAPASQESQSWTLSGTPSASDVGIVSLELRVRDSGSPALEDQTTLQLTVQAAAPAVPALGAWARLAILLLAMLTTFRAIGTVSRRS